MIILKFVYLAYTTYARYTQIWVKHTIAYMFARVRTAFLAIEYSNLSLSPEKVMVLSADFSPSAAAALA